MMKLKEDMEETNIELYKDVKINVVVPRYKYIDRVFRCFKCISHLDCYESQFTMSQPSRLTSIESLHIKIQDRYLDKGYMKNFPEHV